MPCPKGEEPVGGACVRHTYRELHGVACAVQKVFELLQMGHAMGAALLKIFMQFAVFQYAADK